MDGKEKWISKTLPKDVKVFMTYRSNQIDSDDSGINFRLKFIITFGITCLLAGGLFYYFYYSFTYDARKEKDLYAQEVVKEEPKAKKIEREVIRNGYRYYYEGNKIVKEKITG